MMLPHIKTKGKIIRTNDIRPSSPYITVTVKMLNNSVIPFCNLTAIVTMLLLSNTLALNVVLVILVLSKFHV